MCNNNTHPTNREYTWSSAASGKNATDQICISRDDKNFRDGWFYIAVFGSTRAEFEIIIDTISSSSSVWNAGSFRRPATIHALSHVVDGEYFGCEEVLMDCGRIEGAIAVTPVTVYSINKEHFLNHVRGAMARELKMLLRARLQIRIDVLQGILKVREQTQAATLPLPTTLQEQAYQLSLHTVTPTPPIPPTTYKPSTNEYHIFSHPYHYRPDLQSLRKPTNRTLTARKHKETQEMEKLRLTAEIQNEFIRNHPDQCFPGTQMEPTPIWKPSKR